MFDKVFDIAFGTFFRLVFCIVISAVLVFVLGLDADAARSRVPPLERALVEGRVDAEVEVAEGLGFSTVREIPLRAAEHRFIVGVAAGQCVAVVAGTWEERRIQRVALLDVNEEPVTAGERDWIVSHHDIGGVVGHVQHCVENERRLRVVVRTQRLDWAFGEGGARGPGRAVVLRTRAGLAEGATLNRGAVPDDEE